jgi:hypothetical protein
VRPYLEKNPIQKRSDRVVQGEGPKFKPQYSREKKRKKTKSLAMKGKEEDIPEIGLV